MEYNETPKEARALLCERLRSGKHNQGKHHLRTERDGVFFDCCLGVACVLYDDLYPDVLTKDERSDGDGEGLVAFNGHEAYLPEEVMEWLGFGTTIGHFQSPSIGSDNLVDLNDHGASFAEIADLIESEPAGLVV